MMMWLYLNQVMEVHYVTVHNIFWYKILQLDWV
jgi:hypothetical protein